MPLAAGYQLTLPLRCLPPSCAAGYTVLAMLKASRWMCWCCTLEPACALPEACHCQVPRGFHQTACPSQLTPKPASIPHSHPPQNATYLPDAFPKRGPYSPANSPDIVHPVIMQGIRIIDRVAIPGSWCVW